jgi:sugar phosphate isomerase/epimerase
VDDDILNKLPTTEELIGSMSQDSLKTARRKAKEWIATYPRMPGVHLEDMACLSLDIMSAEIGTDHLHRIRELAECLYGTSVLSGRIAPSIVVRGEAELFGLSVPRFACRMYLRAEEDSFVNVRRLEVLVRAVREYLDDPNFAGDCEFQLALTSLIDKLATRESNCVADSLLAPPPRLITEGYHILTTELGLAYGEHRALLGTPYLSNVDIFGGGMCAQAVAFQATALWHSCSQGLYGLAEITSLAEPQDTAWIDLSGMTLNKLVRYFESDHVNLTASNQGVDATFSWEEQIRRFSDILFAYVSSGIPVILPIDLGRMNGIGFGSVAVEGGDIFSRNALPQKLRAHWQKVLPRPHVVLVVGVHPTADRREFLINDPATLPFLKASGQELAAARWYASDETAIRLGPLSFISVTPRDVRLPLLNVTDELAVKVGLVCIAELLQQFSIHSLHWPKLRQYDPGSFRLLDLAESQPNKPRFRCANAGLPTEVVEYLLELVRKGTLPRKWCWAQYKELSYANDDGFLWIWDASEEPPTCTEGLELDLIERFLLAICVRNRGRWSVVMAKASESTHLPGCHLIPPTPSARVKDERVRLRAALISSFAIDGIDHVAQEWDPNVGCELYLWTLSDIASLVNTKRLGSLGFDVTTSMAQLADDVGEIASVASRLVEKNLPIIGFASFIPEITADPAGKQGRRAQLAIRFLARLAVKIHDLQNGRIQPTCINLVCGSRIDRIYRAERLPIGDGKNFKYLAYKMSDADARRRIAFNLVRSLPEALARELSECGISLALDLEPGPLFAVRDWETLRDLVMMIDNNSYLSPITGLNLDIAHWRIAGGDALVDKLMTDGAVRRRIVHAHIAGHHPTAQHLGDIDLCDLNDPKRDFLPWLRLLQNVVTEERPWRLPTFSGYVSHAFEAARNPMGVWDSVRVLQQLLAEA